MPQDMLAAAPVPDAPFPGAPSNPNATGQKTERVVKLFTPAEQIAVIKAEPAEVRLGHGPEARTFTIAPLSSKQLLGAYKLIQELLVPLAKLFRPGVNVNLDDLLNAIGPNLERIPELIQIILQRGNGDVSLDWIENHIDILLDLQILIPIFLKQNGLDKLFAPKGQ
jgi:hypothetical protein